MKSDDRTFHMTLVLPPGDDYKCDSWPSFDLKAMRIVLYKIQGYADCIIGRGPTSREGRGA